MTPRDPMTPYTFRDEFIDDVALLAQDAGLDLFDDVDRLAQLTDETLELVFAVVRAAHQRMQHHAQQRAAGGRPFNPYVSPYNGKHVAERSG